LIDFFNSNMLQIIALGRFLFDQMIPFDWKALEGAIVFHDRQA